MGLEFELQHSGLLIGEENFASSDFALADSLLTEKLKNITPDNPVYEYDQSAQHRTRNACTLYMGIKMISDLWNYKFTTEEILEICDIAEKSYGWSESRGGWLYKAIDCVRTYWNKKNPDKEVVSFFFPLDSKEFEILKNSGKTLGVGYNISTEYYLDSQDNGQIDKNSFAGSKKRGGHAVCFNNGKIIDNYTGKKKFNIYKNEKIERLGREGTFFNNGYVFFKKNDIMENINLKNAKIAYKLGLWNGQNAKNPMTREEVMAVFVNGIKKIASGEVTIGKIEELEKELG
ncbi:hypothetical protein DLH72_05035 [Candidatus Gracilibacteria bacterium]|nr:MAG: hypothetical protein DLH72_05035 [Candidatus Gracilibacteria bacterium]